MKTIIRTALFFVMLIPIVVGAAAGVVVIGFDAGYSGMAGYVADLFDRWS